MTSDGEERDSDERTMGVGSSTSISAEKIWLQDLYPPRREKTIHRRKDDGGGLKHLELCRKNMAAGPVRPAPRGNDPSPQGRWGWAQAPRSRPKKYGCRTYTPPRRGGSFHLGKDDGGPS